MTDPDKSVLDIRELRNAFGKYPTGVTIVTTRESDGNPRGFTANSFTSVSLDPPLLLVCIDKRAASLPVFLESENFAINVLGQNQKDASGLFASQRVDKFDTANWFESTAGMPLIQDSVAWFACAREQHVDAGDHIILIGRVSEFGYQDGKPLGYVGGGYFTFGLEQSMVDVVNQAHGVSIGVLLHQQGKLLLEEVAQSNRLSLPFINGNTSRPSLAKLISKLSSHEFSVSIDFLFAVYEDKNTGIHVVNYRGEATGTPPPGMYFFKFDDIPWHRLIDKPTASMLKRYMKEKAFGKFAVYMGDELQGKVQVLDHNPDETQGA